MRWYYFISLILIATLLSIKILFEAEKSFTVEDKPVKEQNDWESSYLNLTDSKFSGDGIKIAILDTESNYKNINQKQYFIEKKDIIKEEVAHVDEILNVISSVVSDTEIYHGVVAKSSQSVEVQSLIDGIEWAILEDVDIINISLNFPYSNPGIYFESLFELAAENNIIIVSPTGNEGLDTVFFPGSSKHVIAVGGISFKNEKSSFSNYGDGVDFCMPSEHIRVSGDEKKEGVFKDGTSYASALLTGMVARLIKEDEIKSKRQVMQELRSMTPGQKRNDKCGYGVPKFHW